MDRERRDYVLISVALLIAAVAMYLHQEEGLMVALTIAIAAVGTFESYLAGRWYKKRRDKRGVRTHPEGRQSPLHLRLRKPPRDGGRGQDAQGSFIPPITLPSRFEFGDSFVT